MPCLHILMLTQEAHAAAWWCTAVTCKRSRGACRCVSPSRQLPRPPDCMTSHLVCAHMYRPAHMLLRFLRPVQTQPQDVFEPQPAPPKPRIASSITAAHRPELFRRSWHSFQARCLDCHEYISSWYAVDDGSSAEALAQMQQAAPPCTVTWLEKGPQQAGHVGSLNRILEEVQAQGFDYLLHLVSC